MALQSIEKKRAELAAAKADAGTSDGKETLNAVRMGLLVGWLVCLVGAFAIPALGYVFALLIVLWIVVGFAGLFVK